MAERVSAGESDWFLEGEVAERAGQQFWVWNVSFLQGLLCLAGHLLHASCYYNIRKSLSGVSA